MDRQLIDYLPGQLQEIQEMKAIMTAEQPEIEDAWDGKKQIIENSFIMTEDEASAKRWETALDILPSSSDSLDDRNFRILTRMQESIPFTERTFKQMLLALVGSEDNLSLTIDGDTYSVVVIIALSTTDRLAEVKALAERVVPMNMLLTVTLMYATHAMLSTMTYGEMEAYTQSQLRELEF